MTHRRVATAWAATLATAAALAVPGASSAAEPSVDPAPSVVLVSAEALTVDGSHQVEYFVDVEQMAPWVQSDLGNKQLSQDYVYDDPRRAIFNGGEASVTYGIHPGNLSGDVNLHDQKGAMRDALATWDGLTCSDPGLVENAIAPTFPGVVRTFFQTGQLLLIHQADLTQVGFLSAAEFPYFAANPNVLGVAFTLSWVGGDGELTDIDDNGKPDVAFREIYYNDQFEWADDGVLGERGSGYVDLPAVATHEVGHGLSQAHFGNLARRDDGSVVARPRALMNAIYGGIQRDLTGSDVAGHCSNWAMWPQQ
jgi:hypothetical protein